MWCPARYQKVMKNAFHLTTEFSDQRHSHWQRAQQLVPIWHFNIASIFLFQTSKLVSRKSCGKGSRTGNCDEALQRVVLPALPSVMDWIILLGALSYSKKNEKKRRKEEGKGKRKSHPDSPKVSTCLDCAQHLVFASGHFSSIRYVHFPLM